jgi:long-chain acyl-CoA synthetase
MTENNQNGITPEQAVTLHGLLIERVKRTPNGTAYRYFDTNINDWKSLTWLEVSEQVARWQSALIKEQLEPGDRVAVMLRNCPKWIFGRCAAVYRR